MTSPLTHNVAHSTRHSFRPKTNNQPKKVFKSCLQLSKSRQKLDFILENKVVQKLQFPKNVNNKMCAPKIKFFNEKKVRKIWIIFDIENWLCTIMYWNYSLSLYPPSHTAQIKLRHPSIKKSLLYIMWHTCATGFPRTRKSEIKTHESRDRAGQVWDFETLRVPEPDPKRSRKTWCFTGLFWGNPKTRRLIFWGNIWSALLIYCWNCTFG